MNMLCEGKGKGKDLTGLIVEADGKDSPNAKRLDDQGIVETCQVCSLEKML